MNSEGQLRLKNFQHYLIGGLVCGILFLFIFVKLSRGLIYSELMAFDQNLITFVREFDHPATYHFLKIMTFLGSSIVLIFLALLVSFILMRIKKHYWDAAMVIINLSGGWGMNELLKAVFQRERPDIFRLTEASGFSFPSGHAMISFAFYGMILYLVWINFTDNKLKISCTILWFFLVFFIGISRIFLGVHYPSDVIAGYAGGGLWLLGCILGLEAIRYYKAGQNS